MTGGDVLGSSHNVNEPRDLVIQVSSSADPQELALSVFGPVTAVAGYIAVESAGADNSSHLLISGTSDPFDIDQALEQVNVLGREYRESASKSGFLRIINVVDEPLNSGSVLEQMLAQRSFFLDATESWPGLRLGFSSRWTAFVRSGLQVHLVQRGDKIEMTDNVNAVAYDHIPLV